MKRSPPLTPEQLDQLAKLCATTSLKLAAIEMGLTYQRAYFVVKRRGIAFHKQQAGRRFGSADRVPRTRRRVTRVVPASVAPTDMARHYTGIKKGLSRWG